MKILVDPAWATLIENLSDHAKSEILMCILKYPAQDHDSDVWRYIKQQLDTMEIKYQAKCDRMRQNGMLRWAGKNTKSDAIVIASESSSNETINQNKNNVAIASDSSNAAKIVENPVEITETRYQIDDSFSFNRIGTMKPAFTKYMELYPPPVVARAEQTLIKKRYGQSLNMQQIVDWVDQENQFYLQKKKGY